MKLTPSERGKAIDAVVNNDVLNLGGFAMPYVGDTAHPYTIMLRNGFSGYASFTDIDLIRELEKRKEQCCDCRNLLADIAVETILLGSI